MSAAVRPHAGTPQKSYPKEVSTARGFTYGPSRSLWAVLGFFLLMGLIVFAVRHGAWTMPWADLWQFQKGLGALRWPRVLCAVLAGGVLGGTGLSLQTVFRNPLADPGVLGVSSMAALFAALGILAGRWAGAGPWVQSLGVEGFAFVGSAGSLLFLSSRVLLMRGTWQGKSTDTLLLSGVALNALAGALLGVVLFLADDSELRSISFWNMGSLGGASWATCALMALAAPVVLGGLWAQARGLDVLVLGEKNAIHAGLSFRSFLLKILVLCALGTALVVSSFGTLGFVGFLGGHFAKKIIGTNQHAWLIPVSAWFGALLVLAADLGSRCLFPPAEIPLGVILALMGAPLFLWILERKRR